MSSRVTHAAKSPSTQYHGWLRVCVFTLALVAVSAKLTPSHRRDLLQATRINGDRKGMGWVVSNFLLKRELSCDAISSHSPLFVNVTRPDRSSFCLELSARPGENKFGCDKDPYSGQVNTVQILSGSGCVDAVASVTLDGLPWPHVSFDTMSDILSLDYLSTAAPVDATFPSSRTICVSLRPDHPTCPSLPSFCAPTFGPEPACGVLVANVQGTCCPVFRAGFGAVPIRSTVSFWFSARLTSQTYDCTQVNTDPAVVADISARIAAQYGTALGMDASAFGFSSWQCRGARLSALMTVNGLTADEPEVIVSRSFALLRPLASVMGLTGIKANPYMPQPSSVPRPARPARVPLPHPAYYGGYAGEDQPAPTYGRSGR